MSVNYCVFQQKHDLSGTGSYKFYARAQSAGQMSFKKLCAKISDRCTATKADVMASPEGCIYVMKEALEDGKIVRLGDFGSFQLSFFSEGALRREFADRICVLNAECANYRNKKPPTTTIKVCQKPQN